MRFDLLATAPGSSARAGILRTARGDVPTPVFMPVGTRGTVRGQTLGTLRGAGSRILLANTLHLARRPGLDVLDRFGGLHRFGGWDGPILTDSGGYQVFSLPGVKVDDDGVLFPDPAGGPPIRLDPASSLDAQRRIGSDIAMAFDHCVPADADHATAADAVRRTLRWAERSLAARNEGQALFGIVQGAIWPDLRAQSAEGITALPFDGFALGGLAVGETRAQREDMTEHTAALLPADRPRYLMGVGTPLDLLEAVHRGVDLFDCILPTAHAQRGVAYTSRGRLDLRRGAYRFAEEPLDASCGCPVCAVHSRAFLHHLVKSEEILAWQALGEHNLHHTHALMSAMRAHILAGTFAAFHAEARERLDARDAENPPVQPTRKRRRAPPPLELGDYVVHGSGDGPAAIRQRSSGEVMHSVNDPSAEARALYVDQPGLPERLASEGPALVVWDVGLGAGTNAMAALSVGRGARRGLHLVSFERDLDPLRLALLHPARFPHLRDPAPYALLREGTWTGDSCRWDLISGEVPATFDGAPAPDLIFWDPFSFKADAPLWTPSVFARLRACCARPAMLVTYSTSTAVRAALLHAGFWVARGVSTGPKTETTLAFSERPDGQPLLDASWLARWERSAARIPPEIAASGDTERFVAAVRGHPQWLGEGPASDRPTVAAGAAPSNPRKFQ